jgi:uncharacterized protein YcbK (DUF882 family)
MQQTRLMSRRALLGVGFLIPSAASTRPLFDTSRGNGLFSDVAMRKSPESSGLLHMYGDVEPELDRDMKLNPRIDQLFGPSKPLRLALRNLHTNETLQLDLPSRKLLDASQRSQLNYFLRDWRQNEVMAMDGAVVQPFIEICSAFATPGNRVQATVTSGYRSRVTNDMLRQRNRNVAKNSLHVQARAIDFALPGVSMSRLSSQAKKICQGGIGTYRTFLHIDSGPTRSWSV